MRGALGFLPERTRAAGDGSVEAARATAVLTRGAASSLVPMSARVEGGCAGSPRASTAVEEGMRGWAIGGAREVPLPSTRPLALPTNVDGTELVVRRALALPSRLSREGAAVARLEEEVRGGLRPKGKGIVLVGGGAICRTTSASGLGRQPS